MTVPPNKTEIDDLAPTPIEELLLDENPDEDKEGEDGKGGDSKGGGGGKKPDVNVKLKELDDEDLSAYDSESLIEKLKMLVWAPFSAMVPGASAFESEHDLKRKLFLGQLGMITNQIDPQDIADPDFINRLEQRNQMRQQKYGIDVATVAGSAAGISGAVAALQETPKEQQRKQDVKLQAQQPKEASFDAQTEAEEKRRPEAEQKTRLEQQQRLEVKPAPEAEENSFAAEIEREEKTKLQQEAAQPKEEGIGLGEIIHILDQQKEAQAEGIDASEAVKGASGFTAVTDLFNHFAQQTEYNAPEQRVDLKFADPAPKIATVAPGGGV